MYLWHTERSRGRSRHSSARTQILKTTSLVLYYSRVVLLTTIPLQHACCATLSKGNGHWFVEREGKLLGSCNSLHLRYRNGGAGNIYCCCTIDLVDANLISWLCNI